jgi:hypothetical protein
MAASENTALGIRQEALIQGGSAWRIAQKSADLRQIGDAACPQGIPGDTCKVVSCQGLEDVPCLLFQA